MSFAVELKRMPEAEAVDYQIGLRGMAQTPVEEGLHELDLGVVGEREKCVGGV